MTMTRETIETDEPKLVTPEPENTHETSILDEIEKQFCRMDNAQNIFASNWNTWQEGNDISRDDLDEDLCEVINAAGEIRTQIARLAERRVRDEIELLVEDATQSIHKAADAMAAELDINALPGQIESIENALQSIREEFGLLSF